MSRKNVKAIVPDSGKPRVGGNPQYVTRMQGLRGSSAASPHRNRARYTRTAKYRTDYGQDD